MAMYYIGGSPCSGKSTVADALAKRFGLAYFKADDHLDEFIARGAAEDYDKAQHLLMSHSKNRTVFDGLALAEHTEELAKLGVDSEAPTLQQLSIGLLKYAEEIR